MGDEGTPIDKGLGAENKQPVSPVLDERREPGTNYIITIGIDRYKKTSLPNLPNCVKDCKYLIKTLQNGFKKFEVYKELYDDQADRKAILDTIVAFHKDTSVNNVNNNLIIYFSGHGGFVKSPSRKIGSWIPYDYENDEDEEFLRLDFLKTKLEFIQTLHLLIIADCCFSASMFQFDVSCLTEQSSEKIGDLAEIGFEPSRWGIASSRLTQVSGAGEITGHSVFTEELIAVLQQVSSSQIIFRDIANALIKKFGANQVQRVHYKELNVSSDNRGEFTLYAKEEPLKAKLRYTYLAKEIISLNYSDEQTRFFEFKKKRALTLVSGTPDCGLNFIIRLIKNSMFFPAHTCWPVNAQLVDGTDEQRMLNLFKMAGKGEQSFSTIDELTKLLLKKLQDKNLLLEVRFYADARPLGDITQKRKRIIEELATFTESVNNMVTGDNRLCIVIIDFENARYSSNFPDKKISKTEAIIFDKERELKIKEFFDWYDNVQNRYRKPSGEKSEFNLLFDDILFNQAELIFPEDKGFPPGYVIQKICVLSNCIELAEKLLN